MRVKPLDQIRAKWDRVCSQRAGDYEEGVKNPRLPWDQAARAAEPNYEAGVQAAIGKKKFGKGVTAAGNAKWADGATKKGVARWPVGVSVAGPEFEKGFGPFRNALEARTLTPRKARRDPSNLVRVNEVVQTMIKAAESAGR